MKSGPARFNFFLDQLQGLLIKAAKQKNPALWLYSNNVRTPLFMLEALSRLYANLHNKKKFTKLKEQFKFLEDALGAIDYYDSFAKEFGKNKKMPDDVTGYLEAQTREKIQSLNELLQEKKWLPDAKKKISKIKIKLAEADWKDQKKEIDELHEYFGEEILEITAFVKETNYHFDNVEADVHELRRKLRWLSIYVTALRGAVQVTKTNNQAKELQKYLTKEIIASPFNVIPEAGNNQHFLLLNQDYFYSLSWIIAELGKLKDSGLRIIALKEALQQTSIKDEAEAYKKAYLLTGKEQPTIQSLLDKAEVICRTYFDEHNLEQLVIGTAATK